MPETHLKVVAKTENLEVEQNPITIRGDINTLDSRSAMGLPPDYVDLRFSDIQESLTANRELSPEQLMAKIENRQYSIDERYACGQLLALVGDPRINTLNPSMQKIAGGSVGIGLEPHCVNSVVEQYRSVGVLEEWIQKETPRFFVDVQPFQLARYPVTNKEYRDFLIENPSAEIPSSWNFGRYPTAQSNHPVYTISEFSAEAYCQWLSEKSGRLFRLPTEIEWEYAASGREGFAYPWGDHYLPDHANTAEFELFDSTPVGLFIEGASPFGVLDMAGNVEEYTADDYWAYPGGEIIKDDLVKQQQQYRVARGGSFTRFADLARCRRRHGRYNKDIYVMGFRLAESI